MKVGVRVIYKMAEDSSTKEKVHRCWLREIKRLRNFQSFCPQYIKLLFNIILVVRRREEDLWKNYTKNFREKVEPPLNQQEGKFMYEALLRISFSRGLILCHNYNKNKKCLQVVHCWTAFISRNEWEWRVDMLIVAKPCFLFLLNCKYSEICHCINVWFCKWSHC